MQKLQKLMNMISLVINGVFLMIPYGVVLFHPVGQNQNTVVVQREPLSSMEKMVNSGVNIIMIGVVLKLILFKRQRQRLPPLRPLRPPPPRLPRLPRRLQPQPFLHHPLYVLDRMVSVEVLNTMDRPVVVIPPKPVRI